MVDMASFIPALTGLNPPARPTTLDVPSSTTGRLLNALNTSNSSKVALLDKPPPVSLSDLQKLIQGELTPSQADRVINAAVRNEGALKLLIGALKWGAIASIPFLLTGDSDPRIEASQQLTQLLRKGDIHGFFNTLKRLDGNDAAKVRGTEGTATMIANLLGAGKPHTASQILQNLIDALQSEGLVNIPTNVSDVALQAIEAHQQNHPKLGPPRPAPLALPPSTPHTTQRPLPSPALDHARELLGKVVIPKAMVLKAAVDEIDKTRQEITRLCKLFNATSTGGRAAAPRLVDLAKQLQKEFSRLGSQTHMLTISGGVIEQFKAPYSRLETLVNQHHLKLEAIGLGGPEGLKKWQMMSNSAHQGMAVYTQRTNDALRQTQSFIRQANSYVRGLDAAKVEQQAKQAATQVQRASQPTQTHTSSTSSAPYKAPPDAAAPTEADKLREEWEKLGNSDAGEQLMTEAERNGWSQQDVLDYINAHPDKNLNEVLNALRDGALGIGGTRGGNTRVGVAAPGDEPESNINTQPVTRLSDQEIETRVRAKAIIYEWTEKLITALITHLKYHYLTSEEQAQLAGIKTAAYITNLKRAVAAIRAEEPAFTNTKTDRMVQIAKILGISSAKLFTRIESVNDTELGLRVINRIPASHRERVAEVILSMHTYYIKSVYLLNKLFTEGEPLGNGRYIQKSEDSNSRLSNRLYQDFGINPKTDTASNDQLTRVKFLRHLGFSYQDILQMNPVWHQLARRLDPNLGTYSKQVYAANPSLPRSREEAARRIIESGLSYRQSSVLAFTSDAPWLNSSELTDIYLTANPNANQKTGKIDRAEAFAAADILLGRKIPRGTSVELQTPEHQKQLNQQLLQLFGLGGRKAGLPGLYPIPPGLSTSWPTPQNNPLTRQGTPRRSSPGNESVTWQQILPLLLNK